MYYYHITKTSVLYHVCRDHVLLVENIIRESVEKQQ